MNKPIRLGFAGCGEHGLRHAQAAVQMPDIFQVWAAFDPDEQKALEFAKNLPTSTGTIVRASSLDALLGNVDAVVIASPHQFHLEQLQTAINFRKHILCEKPVWVGVRKTKTARWLINDTERRGLVLSSCHPRRLEPPYVFLRGQLKKLRALYGDLREISSRFFYKTPSAGWKMQDDLLLDHFTHEIDITRWFLWELDRGARFKLRYLDSAHDYYQVAGWVPSTRQSGGIMVNFAGYRRLQGEIFRNEMELTFERGRARAGSVLNSITGEAQSDVTEEDFETGAILHHDCYLKEYPAELPLIGIMKNFGEAILEGKACYLSPADIIENNMICNELFERGKYGTD